MKEKNAPLERLKHHVTGAIERGEKVAIVGKPAMKENKHTPGPWVFDERRNQICSAHPDFNNSLIAKIATGEDLREEHANAQLIASAPELLGALENIDSILQGDMRDALHDESREAYQFIEQLRRLRGLNMTVGKIARQAIAKAKGGL